MPACLPGQRVLVAQLSSPAPPRLPAVCLWLHLITPAAMPVVMVDDGDFDQRWAESMRGIASENVEEAVEHMKMM